MGVVMVRKMRRREPGMKKKEISHSGEIQKKRRIRRKTEGQGKTVIE